MYKTEPKKFFDQNSAMIIFVQKDFFGCGIESRRASKGKLRDHLESHHNTPGER